MTVEVDRIADAIVVPEAAVMETEAGPVVYLVDDEGKVAIQRVEAAQSYEGLRVVVSGLKAGTPVIVHGLQLVRPGMPVKTEAAVLARPASQATASSPDAGTTEKAAAKPVATDASPKVQGGASGTPSAAASP
jgi:membrane fusion protein (multidrug efflux system)